MNKMNRTQRNAPHRRIYHGAAIVGLSIAPLALMAAPANSAESAHPLIHTANDDVESGSDRGLTGAAYDAFLEGRLVTAYTINTSLNPFDLDVEVRNQKATVGGAVESEVHRDLAIEIASGMDAIVEVDDEISVEANLDQQAENPRDLGETMEDGSTTAAVKTRLLANGSTSGLSIDVDTNGSTVTLSGRVETDTEAELAKQIALNTDGVDEVVTKLRVEGSAS